MPRAASTSRRTGATARRVASTINAAPSATARAVARRRREHGVAQLPTERVQAHADAHIAQHLVVRAAGTQSGPRERGCRIIVAYRGEDVEIGRAAGFVAARRVHHVSAQRAQGRPVEAPRPHMRAALGEHAPVGDPARRRSRPARPRCCAREPAPALAGEPVWSPRPLAQRDGVGQLQAQIEQDVLAFAGLLVDDETRHAAGGQQDEQDAEQVELGDEALAFCHRLSVARRSRLAGVTALRPPVPRRPRRSPSALATGYRQKQAKIKG